MTGILKVDTIQKNDGTVPTLADLGISNEVPRFEVRLNQDQTGITDMTTFVVPFNVTDIDTETGFDGDRTYTIQVAGTYLLHASALLYGNEGKNRDSHLGILKSTDGGSSYSSIANDGSRHGGTYDQTSQTHNVIVMHQFDVGDKIQVWSMVNTGDSSGWRVQASSSPIVNYGIGWIDNGTRYTRFSGLKIA